MNKCEASHPIIPIAILICQTANAVRGHYFPTIDRVKTIMAASRDVTELDPENAHSCRQAPNGGKSHGAKFGGIGSRTTTHGEYRSQLRVSAWYKYAINKRLYAWALLAPFCIFSWAYTHS